MQADDMMYEMMTGVCTTLKFATLASQSHFHSTCCLFGLVLCPNGRGQIVSDPGLLSRPAVLSTALTPV